MKQVLAPVISNIEVIPETYLIRLEAGAIAATARPGQFVMVRCGEDTLLRRPISIHQVYKNHIALLVNIAGRGTRWLAERKPRDTVDIFGPLGNGFNIRPESENLLLVAGGIGIAPLQFLADAGMAQKKKVTLLAGAASACNLLPVMPVLPGAIAGDILPVPINTVSCTEDGTEGFKGRVTTLIKAYLNGIDQVFACGPAGMYRTMMGMPELKGKAVQLSLEIMMGCGTGVCYGCTVKTKKGLQQVCKDGPVFEMGDLIPESFKGV